MPFSILASGGIWITLTACEGKVAKGVDEHVSYRWICSISTKEVRVDDWSLVCEDFFRFVVPVEMRCRGSADIPLDEVVVEGVVAERDVEG